MSAYDNMCVRANTSLVAHVCSRNVSTSNYRNKSLLRKSIGWARVCLLLLLVVSPVSANPVRSRRTSHHRASAEAAAAAAAAAQRRKTDDLQNSPQTLPLGGVG
nr:uncharacterized protein LOC113822113 [Penaeus vannamei]